MAKQNGAGQWLSVARSYTVRRRRTLIPLLLLGLCAIAFLSSPGSPALGLQAHLRARPPANANADILPNIEYEPSMVVASRLGFAQVDLGDKTHPISKLIRQGRRKWRELLDRQSATLADAVEEYRRRYSRYPPKGFDVWWKFARDRNVHLIDEYDKMYEDLDLFYAFSPQDVRKLQEGIGGRGGRTTWIKMENGTVAAGEDNGFRINPLREWLMQFVQHFDEPLLLHLNINDEPYSGYIPYRIRETLRKAARQGKTVTMAEIDQIHDRLDGGISTLARACPDDSALVKHEHAYGHDVYPDVPPDAATSFVEDAKAAGDVCSHPYLAKMHYSFSPNTVIDYSVRYPSPIFAFSKTRLESDIILPTLDQFDDSDPLLDPLAAWPLMSDRAVWRGGTKAGHWGDNTSNAARWKWNSQRIRLRLLQSNRTGMYPLVWSETSSDDSGLLGEATQEMGLYSSSVDVKGLIKRYLDIAFSEPSQCGEVCDIFDRPPLGPCERMEVKQANHFRYVFDVDGNGWSGRFPRLLRARQVVLKSTLIEEFNADWRIPWVHYVPLSPSYEEIFNIMTYFTGQDGVNHHQEDAYKIAQQGRDWRIKFWRRAEQDAYMFRLLLEWRRILSDKRDTPAMEYRGPSRLSLRAND